MVLLGLTLVGCAWRFDSPDPALPSPDADESARDAVALAEAELVASLEEASPAGPGGEWLLAYESRAADAHLEALGGVYDPYPDPSPSPTSSDDPGFGPSSFTRYASFARDAAIEASLTAEDPDLALLIASIALSDAAALRLQSEEDARAAGVEVYTSVDRLLPLPSALDPAVYGPSVLLPEATSLPEATLEELILLHDYAAYVDEVVAARAEGSLRGVAYQRSLLHQARAEALVALADVDPRGPSYVTDRTRLASNETMEALLSEVEAGLADAYVAAFGQVVAGDADSPVERIWLLNGAFDAGVASFLWAPSPEDVPMFPGVDVPSA